MREMWHTNVRMKSFHGLEDCKFKTKNRECELGHVETLLGLEVSEIAVVNGYRPL